MGDESETPKEPQRTELNRMNASHEMGAWVSPKVVEELGEALMTKVWGEKPEILPSPISYVPTSCSEYSWDYIERIFGFIKKLKPNDIRIESGNQSPLRLTVIDHNGDKQLVVLLAPKVYED